MKQKFQSEIHFTSLDLNHTNQTYIKGTEEQKNFLQDRNK